MEFLIFLKKNKLYIILNIENYFMLWKSRGKEKTHSKIQFMHDQLGVVLHVIFSG